MFKRGPPCGTQNCPSQLYRTSDGTTFCQFGHIVEGDFEYIDDDDFSGAMTKRITQVSYDERGVLRSQKQVHRKEKPQKVYGMAAKALYYKCLQVLLKQLLSSLQASENLVQVAKINWTKVVSACYKDNSASTHIYTLDLLAIVVISAAQLRQYPIYACDIIQDVRDGKIPYFRTLHLVPAQLLAQLPPIYHTQLQPHRIPSASLLLQHVRENVARMSLSLKVPVSYYYLLAMEVAGNLERFCSVVQLCRLLKRDVFDVEEGESEILGGVLLVLEEEKEKRSEDKGKKNCEDFDKGKNQFKTGHSTPGHRPVLGNERGPVENRVPVENKGPVENVPFGVPVLVPVLGNKTPSEQTPTLGRNGTSNGKCGDTQTDGTERTAGHECGDGRGDRSGDDPDSGGSDMTLSSSMSSTSSDPWLTGESPVHTWSDEMVERYCDWLYGRFLARDARDVPTRRLWQIFDTAECMRGVANPGKLRTRNTRVCRTMCTELGGPVVGHKRTAWKTALNTVTEKLHNTY